MNFLDYNKDGKVDIDDFFELVYDLMKDQKSNKMLDGKDKKMNVMISIRNIVGQQIYDRYEPLLSQSIEFIYKKMMKSKCCKFFRCS